MKSNQSNIARRRVVICFATIMARVESAVVVYLRTMIDHLEPLQPEPLPGIGSLGYHLALRNFGDVGYNPETGRQFAPARSAGQPVHLPTRTA